MRTRFRNDSDQCRENYHQCSVAADPLVQAYILQTYSNDKKNSECPKEYRQEMLCNYADIRNRLGGSGASAAVAQAMIQELKNQ